MKHALSCITVLVVVVLLSLISLTQPISNVDRNTEIFGPQIHLQEALIMNQCNALKALFSDSGHVSTLEGSALLLPFTTTALHSTFEGNTLTMARFLPGIS